VVPRRRLAPVLAARDRRQDPRFRAAFVYAARGPPARARLAGAICSGKSLERNIALRLPDRSLKRKIALGLAATEHPVR